MITKNSQGQWVLIKKKIKKGEVVEVIQVYHSWKENLRSNLISKTKILSKKVHQKAIEKFRFHMEAISY